MVQRYARATETGKWKPVISVQPRGGVTDLHQAIVEEEYETFAEASIRSLALAKRLIDTGEL